MRSPHANFSVKIHCMFPMGIISLGYNPLNQTAVKGTILVGSQSFRNPENQRRLICVPICLEGGDQQKMASV